MKITITREHYEQESTDPNEIREARKSGPRLPSGERDENDNPIRIPHSGFEYGGNIYKLDGWGKMDREITNNIPVPKTISDFLIRMLKNAYTFNFSQEDKAALSAFITAHGKEAFAKLKDGYFRAREADNGPLQSYRIAVGLVENVTQPSGKGVEQPHHATPKITQAFTDDE